MNKKLLFIDYMKNGGAKPIFSPQIGAGAGFDTKVLNKQFASMEDTIRVTEMFDMLPLFNFGVDFAQAAPKLAWLHKDTRKNGSHTIYQYSISTTFGDMTMESTINEKGDIARTKDAIESEKDFDKLNWYLDELIKGDFSVYKKIAEDNYKLIGNKGVVDYQWGLQPYELFSLPNTMNNMLIAMDFEREFFEFMDKTVEISKKIIDVLSGRADFVFLGGPAAEMVNPYIFETYMVPYGKKMTDYAHSKNLYIYSHVCSPIEPFLSKGYYNQIGIDLFETLSMPPVGNVKSIEDAFSKLDKNICTRGNVGIDKLINSSPEEIYNYTLHIMEAAVNMGRKHMVAASDYLMAECKFENVKAMEEAVKNFI